MLFFFANFLSVAHLAMVAVRPRDLISEVYRTYQLGYS